MRVNRFTERFLPNRLRRAISKNARGANSRCLIRHAVGFLDLRPDFEAAAVAERRRRGFLDRDQQVAPGFVAVRSCVMRVRRNSPSAVSRRWLSMTASRPSGSPGLICSSRSIVSVRVRSLPTIST